MASSLISARRTDGPLPRNYKWIALSNTTLAVLLATLDGSITIIAMPDIFRGIHLNPLEPGNSFYLLWMSRVSRAARFVVVAAFGVSCAADRSDSRGSVPTGSKVTALFLSDPWS